MKKAENLGAMLNAFKLEPLNEINLPEFYYDNTMPIRTGHIVSSPLEDLFENCTMTSDANAHILVGHRGCGKSTELFNLERRLKEGGQPVHIYRTELEANLHLADGWDIMLFITEGLCKIAEKYNIELPSNTLQTIFDYINSDKEIVGISDTSTSFGIGAMLNFFASIKSNLQFDTKMRTTVTERIKKRASEWQLHIDEIAGRIAKGTGGKHPILIFEGLDKIEPPARAFEIFNKHEVLAKMSFPIIYTFPISLTYDSAFASIKGLYDVHVLPMIKVSNANKHQNDDGIEVMRKIVELRADSQLFDEKALEELIKQTGGVLRHLFECIVSASRLARRRGANKIEMEDAHRALSDLLADDLSKQFDDTEHNMLKKIFNDPDYRKRIGERESLLKQMHALVVLEYKNGNRWHDLHPLISKFLIEQGIINDEKQ